MTAFFKINLASEYDEDHKRQPSPTHLAMSFMRKHYAEHLNLEDLAKVSGVSKFQLIRAFQRDLQTTPIKWLWSYRVKMAMSMMKNRRDLPLKEIAKQTGFANQAHFSRMFRSHFQSPPLLYRHFFFKESREPGDVPSRSCD